MSYAEHIPADWKMEPGKLPEIQPETLNPLPSPTAIASGISFLFGVAIAAIIIVPRVAPGLAFGIWQGPLANPDGVVPVPLLSGSLAELIVQLYPARGLYHLNLQSAIPAILACGVVAVFAYLLASSIMRLPTAVLAGVAAAAMLALNPGFHYTATAAHPALLTVSLALAAVLTVLACRSRERSTLMVALSGVFAGLAAANHPAFGLLLPLFALWLLMASEPGAPILTRVFALTIGFAIAAILPLQSAMRQGEDFRAFLNHALYTPFPAPGAWPPDQDFGIAFLEAIPAGIVWLALPAVPLLMRSASRLHAALLIMLFLFFGPLLTLVTNPNTGVLNPSMDDGPLLFVLAMAACFMGVGLIYLCEIVAARLPSGRVSFALCLCGLGVYLAVLWPALPDRRHAWAEELGSELISAANVDGVVLSGDPRLTSLLMAAVHASESSGDLAIVSTRALFDPSGYGHHRLARMGLLPRVGFMDGHESERWRHELVLHTLAEDSGQHGRLDDFVLWDYVSANIHRQPLVFAGISTPWLASRALRRGLTLEYPRVDASGGPERLPLHTPEVVPNDPDGIKTITALLLPLSEHARAQASAGTAKRIAQEVHELEPSNAEAMLARVRAEARLGERDAALRTAAAYLAQVPAGAASSPVEKLLEADFERHVREDAMLEYLKDIDSKEEDWTRRDHYLAPLWEAEEFVLLAAAYEAIQRSHALDLDAAYQLAAVRAQLGEWIKVDRLIARWQRVAGLTDEEVRNALVRDGRFAHYIRHKRIPTGPLTGV